MLPAPNFFRGVAIAHPGFRGLRDVTEYAPDGSMDAPRVLGDALGVTVSLATLTSREPYYAGGELTREHEVIGVHAAWEPHAAPPPDSPDSVFWLLVRSPALLRDWCQSLRSRSPGELPLFVVLDLARMVECFIDGRAGERHLKLATLHARIEGGDAVRSLSLHATTDPGADDAQSKRILASLEHSQVYRAARSVGCVIAPKSCRVVYDAPGQTRLSTYMDGFGNFGLHIARGAGNLVVLPLVMGFCAKNLLCRFRAEVPLLRVPEFGQ